MEGPAINSDFLELQSSKKRTILSAAATTQWKDYLT